jgi:hypothetical protein
MGALSQVLKITFEVQRKMRNEKITRRKISFPTYKTFFFPFWTPPIFKPHNFLIYYSFKMINFFLKAPLEVLQVLWLLL